MISRKIQSLGLEKKKVKNKLKFPKLNTSYLEKLRNKRFLSEIRSLVDKNKKLVIGVFLTIAFLAYLIFYLPNYLKKQNHQSSDPSIITFSVDNPSEDPINPETYNSTAGPDEPKYIRLPSINAEGFVQKVGVDQNRQIAVPTNTNLAGWFVDTVKPGQKGLSIIDGHVDGRSSGSKGIFNQLGNLAEGQTFEIEFGNGSIKKFKIFDSMEVTKEEANNFLFSQNPKVVSQVNLITCVGNYLEKERTYDKRLIVYSQLVN